jgi:lysophospholipase L1-like esterase
MLNRFESNNLRTVVSGILVSLALVLAGPALAAKGGNGGGKPSDGDGGGGGGGGGGGKTKPAPTRVEGAGDSIMRGYNADCTGNTGLFDFLCFGGGDQDQNSFLDGTSSSVLSIVDRYVQQERKATGGKAASASGSEMTDPGKNNFATQATNIVASATQPVKVVVELGGNDLCNRANEAELYTDAEWEAAVDAGLQLLVDGLPDGSTVLLSSVPRVQDLRAAGIAKQTGNGGVNCESFWATYDVCRIATGSDTFFGALNAQQKSYNEILVERAAAFNDQATSTGVEVVAEYQGEGVESVGTYAFGASDINGGDCFHPSISGQNELSRIIWQNNPFK